ncbi:MAG: Uma2 family endonuclease [Bacteroidetes bacterium]|nr:Uma2 family endonuclease [Bacteroidota bacterium]
MKVEEPDLSGSYNYSDYVTWQLPDMVELIRGKIFKMSPAPSSRHQKVSLSLVLKIGNYLKDKNCQLFPAPFDVRLPLSSKQKSDKEIITVVQPDLCVICDPDKIDERGCLGAPDWIIEILSPHTSTKDLREKFDVYEEAGVKEYWVIHPQEQTVLVYLLNDHGRYEGTLKPYVRTDHLSPATLPGLTIALEEIFPLEGW